MRDARCANGTANRVRCALRASRIAHRASTPYRSSSEPPHAPVSPLGAEQRDQEQEDRRHVPEVHLANDGDTASAEREVLREVLHRARRVEAPARLLGDAAEQRATHLGTEELLLR